MCTVPQLFAQRAREGVNRLGALGLRFRKAGTVWCGGARQTHKATFYNRVIPMKTKETLKATCFSRYNIEILAKFKGLIMNFY